MKKIIIFWLLIFLYSSFAFAQNEKAGVIIATAGIGIGSSKIMDTDRQVSFIFGLDIISRTGFTICLTDIISLRNGPPSQNILFGAGYYYLRDGWNIGAAIFISPISTDLLFGGKITGGYYFTEDLGITGTFFHRRTIGSNANWEVSIYDAFLGASIKLQ